MKISKLYNFFSFDKKNTSLRSNEVHLSKCINCLLFKMKKKKDQKFALGVHMMCLDGHYIVGIDYDRLKINFIKNEIKRIRQQHALGTFYIIESSQRKYHAICFDKVTIWEYRRILLDSTCDEKFSASLNYFGEPKVLRINQSMRLISIIGEKGNTLRSESTPHKRIYSLFGIISQKNFLNTALDDCIKNISMVIYQK